MATLHELGRAVQARRSEMGLTQAALARLSGLSRQTINQVENGTVNDLGIGRVERLAQALGLSLRVEQPGKSRKVARPAKATALELAARTAGVSYRSRLDPVQLRHFITDLSVPPDFLPHVHTLLDEAPVSLLSAVADQLEDEGAFSRDVAWQHFRAMARQVKSKRGLWQ